jgi:uncharacterized protein YdeI (YjbR/CyaY-like superfamily)
MDIGETLYVSDAADWRSWLEQNHSTRPEIWLVFYSKASAMPSLPYNDAVEEALCFGWIDSTNKKLGPESRAQRFTPRRRGSALSPMNAERIRRLAAAGRMTIAGFEAIGNDLNAPFVMPKDIEAALQSDEAVWRNFQAFPEGYQRIRVGWVDGARRRPAEFEKRLRYLVRMTARNKRFGMVQ